jgi:hypothetical protein
MIDDMFNESGQCILVYMATETETDPFEHTIELTELQPVRLRAIVTDLVASQSQWKMPGIVTEKAKELLIEKKYKALIENSYRIVIDGETYHGWKVHGRMQIREEGDFIRVFVYIKKEVE